MKATFEVKAFLSANREMVISEYNKLTENRFFNGINQVAFMVEVLNLMVINAPKSEKRAASLLPFMVGRVSANNSKILAEDKVTNALKAKYNNTPFMALV